MANDISRRLFLKIIAATGAAASGCRSPAARDLIPYVIPDENIVPGVPNFYATLCRECPAGCGVVARVREGRVTKLEGNPQDPIGAGALCARGQAALQGLYNPDRVTAPQSVDRSGTRSSLSWEAALQSLAEHLRTAAGAGADRVAFVGAPSGPTLTHIVERWLAVWHSQRQLEYEPLGDGAARAAAELCFGRSDQPVYKLDAAEVVISFGANFLETWGSPVEQTRQYAAFRALRAGTDGTTMGRAVYIGPRFGLTAAKCDEWIGVRPGAEALVALGILSVLVRDNLVGGSLDVASLKQFTSRYDPAAVAEQTGVPIATLRRLAHQFGTASSAVAMAGTTDVATHVATFLLNSVTGNVGRTVRFLDGAVSPSPNRSQDIASLINAMHAGQIDVLVVANANPVFTLPGFSEALSGVHEVVWCGGVPDETAARAHLLLPCHHTLEEWSDAAPRPGVTLLGQPVMQPVFATMPLGDILLATVHAVGAPSEALPWENTQAAIEATWREIHAKRAESSSFDDFWKQAREAGGIFDTVAPATVSLRSATFDAQLDLPQLSQGLTLSAFPHIFLYDGRGADKPWLQEIPEPVSQIVWNSWAEIHPSTAARLGVAEGDVVEIRSTQGRMEVSAHLSEHVQPEVIAAPLGQGHDDYGRYASQRGANPWPLLPLGARAVGVEVRRTGKRRRLVSPLGLPDMLGRPIVEAVDLEDFRRGVVPPVEETNVTGPYEMHEVHVYPKHQWGMTIDLNACTGCSACVAACYAENNVPVVGEEEVARGHIMSWIRIERFVPTAADEPPLYIMPMLCQQCDHAPCESVCPVYASSHTDEGLNAQVYNRCIGTRYCNNNCPYKVRRFNWFLPQWPTPLQLQLNPDVTARGAGVMEKCTFCIQRIRAAEMDAGAEHRSVADGEIVPACAQACPARAITFGDMKDGKSAMMRRRTEHREREYRALEDLNTQPAIVYLRQLFRRKEEA